MDGTSKGLVKKGYSIPLELREGEVVKREIRPNMNKYLFRQAVKGILLFFVVYIIVLLILSNFYNFKKAGAGTLYISAVVLLAYMAISMISYPRKLYWITTQRIIESGGILSNKLNFTPLESISYIEAQTNTLDKMTGLCHMKINRDLKAGFIDADATPVGKTGKDVIQFVEKKQSNELELELQGLIELRRNSIKKGTAQTAKS
ncbi:MAG: hypothetical protein QXN59_02155 [Candidatus Micrarchaeaceae archaeon]